MRRDDVVANPANLADLANLVRASAELELVLADLEGFDLVFERGGGNAKLRGCP